MSLFIQLLKIVCSKLRKLVSCCVSQMSKLGAVFQKLMVIRNSGNSFRYAVFGVLIGLFLVMYILPAFVRWTRWFQSGHVASCLDGELYGYESAVRSNDVVYAHTPSKESEAFSPMPMSGNGFLLVSMLDGQIYIKHHRTLSVPTRAGVLYQAEISSHDISKSETMTMAHVADGYVQTVTCATGLDHPATILNKVYAHRSILSLVVQEITVKNPSSTPLKVTLRRQSPSQTTNTPYESVLAAYVTPSAGPNDKSRTFYTLQVFVDVPDSKNGTYLHVLQSGLPRSNEVVVEARKSESFVILTLANYTHFDDVPSHMTPAQEKDQSVQNQRSLSALLGTLPDPRTLFRKHAEFSRKMYATGFGISHSKAPNAVNGDRVNLTLNYVAAHYQTISLMKSVAMQTAEKTIFDADKCYDDHHTLQHSRLWDMPGTTDDYFDFVRRWAITLEKHGCRDLMAVGAEGVITSMVLSFGGLHFTSHHLEFGIHPSDLHRDLMHFRGLPYGPHVTLNISVQMGDDNRAQLYVSVDRVGTAYYACDAGCLDAPVLLGQTPVRIPVKLTNPVMPILYVTSDKAHIEELKDALHFKEIQEAPAHEDDVIALHKHGHQFGGLPTIFWVTIILLIVIFHLFLIKLIVTEYYKTESKYSPPPVSYHRIQRFAA